jgi:predicted transcriptional regulator
VKKHDVIEIVSKLSEDEEVDIDRLIYALHFRREVDRGLADADAGREVSLDEIDKMLDEWPE